jgi:hypothetical protein
VIAGSVGFNTVTRVVGVQCFVRRFKGACMRTGE